ncbi:sensor histidine kinase [Desulforhabdus amnigena]|jgi:PAS domain S-box-containing protein|uniref:histidine kinase n=1 Tax=Desulforhabdus amnigena TaxID=40218 RepID=A0A9W6FT85_9BACT|nr:sensor histidine kinase [Desulforhabdus amnigena]NLJ28621.1 PAS domain S-box protein [Deltaproteobacteria bacterium]GLI33245.1 sensor histidine kinase [Desulforhabdus amnigena]
MESKERIKLHKVLKIFGGITLLLMCGALYLGISTARYMKDTIRDQFNEQQLVLAKATAHRIESTIQSAIADLVLLNSLPAIQYCDSDAYEILLLSTLPVLNRDNIVEIRRVDREGNTLFVANDQGIGMKHFGLLHQEAGVYLSWASDLNHRGKTMGTGVRSKDQAKDKKTLVFDLITPTYEDSTDSAHPRPSHRFSGYLKVTLDVARLFHQIIPSIRSGKTGYAWVLDSSGTFLYHPESSFVGENAFEVRSNRNQAISFSKINQIQREEMLKGKEGKSVYTSGWHRDVVEPMEKLIAFAPVHIQGPYMDYAWSVAVVAPLQEIEGTIGMVYERQMGLQGIVILIILIGSLTVIIYEMRWSTLLEHEVNIKTDHIRHYAEQLERSEAKYRSLIESAEDLIFTLDSEGFIKTANEHMSRLFGIESGTLVGQSLYSFLPREQTDEQLRLIREVLGSGKAQRTEILINIQNEDFWFNIQYIPVKGEGNEDRAILGIGRDITDRKSLEKQLINTEKLASLGTLAAGVAHEINNPIGIMLGFCDLLLEKMEPGTMEYNDLKTIERHGLHCKSIVERLLSFARISEETEEGCNINENVEAILSVVKHTLDMNNIRLVTELDDDLPIVRGDSRGLQQVLLNLISNAIHAMNGKGTLTVSTRLAPKPGWVETIVSDTGCGIKKEFLQKIFDPFFTTKKVGEGTGLGLSVSYGIITKYGGTIQCESHVDDGKPGHGGTTFTILLPVHVESLTEVPPSARDANPPKP